MEIQVEHLTRVEGHGNILVALEGGRVKEAIFEIVEANRFFEGFLRGRSYEEVCHLATRICGICAVSHGTAALTAVERAVGLELSEQAELLRRLAMNAEVMSSHALHVYFLAAPDFLGLESVLPLVKKDPEKVRLAFRVKTTAYDLGEVVVGRHTHPVATVPGGFASVPKAGALEEMRGRLEGLRPDLEATVGLVGSFETPEFERETEYVSLRRDDRYAFWDGEIVSSEGKSVDPGEYLDVIEEYVPARGTAKCARWNRESYMVGALARLNNNWRQLRPEAQRAMRELGIEPPCHNPLMNTAAQVVELVHCLEDSIVVIEEVLGRGLADEPEPEISPRAGRGVGAVEAPRGLLIHDYTFDENGRCASANCVIPTAQNLANLNADMEALVPRMADRPRDEIQRGLEMLVRAYDPCISCSVH